MADRVISIRLDPETEAALAVLTESGATRSVAVRGAVIDAAARRRRSAVADEARALAADPLDRAEIAEVRELMDSLRVDG